MKTLTLKREGIYTIDYMDLDRLRRNIEAFIEDYYNRSILEVRKRPDFFV